MADLVAVSAGLNFFKHLAINPFLACSRKKVSCRVHGAFSSGPQLVVYMLPSNKRASDGIYVNRSGTTYRFVQPRNFSQEQGLVTVFKELIVLDFFIMKGEEGEG